MSRDEATYREAQIAATLAVGMVSAPVRPQEMITAYSQMLNYIRSQSIDLINPPAPSDRTTK